MFCVEKISLIILKHYIFMLRNFPGNKLLRKLFLLNHLKCVDTNQGVFQKEETEGYLKMNLKKITNIEYVWVSLEVTSKFNFPVITPNRHPHHTNRRVIHLFIFTPLLYHGIFWLVKTFLNTKTPLKW